jgi:hypothetical protein
LENSYIFWIKIGIILKNQISCVLVSSKNIWMETSTPGNHCRVDVTYEHLGQEWGVLPEIFVHSKLENCFSPVVITESSLQSVDSVQIPELMWRLSWSDPENDFEHFKQMYGFSPVWVLKCICNLDNRPNNFEHLGQEWGV